MKLKINIFQSPNWSGHSLFASSLRMDTLPDYVFITEVEIDFEIPADFDPIKVQVEALQAQKKQVMAEFAARCTEIERRINQLTCIENSVEVAV